MGGRLLSTLVGLATLWLATMLGNMPAAASEDGRLFAAAIFAGDIATVEKLIAEGRDINGTAPDDNGNETRTTPLMLATYRENEEVVRLLVENGARVDLVDDYNRSALWYAVFQQNLELVEFLGDIEGSRKVVNLPDKPLRETPLHVAVSLDDPEIVRYLREIGASTESLNFEELTVTEACRENPTPACKGLRQ